MGETPLLINNEYNTKVGIAMIIQLDINVDIPDSVDIYSTDAEPSIHSD